MVVDITLSYDSTKMQYLHDMRAKIIVHLAQKVDPKKIISFLPKVGITEINEQEKIVYIGVPNDFVLTQVKKFFQKPLKESIQEIYNIQFTIKLVVFMPFQKNHHDLLVNIKKLLDIKEEKISTKQVDMSLKKQLNDHFGILFEPSFTFQNLIVGSHNNFAVATAKAVVDHPGTEHNPLFIYGNVGLGKTHLMQAIGNELMKNNPQQVVLYLPTSKLVDEIVDAIRANKLNNLLKKFDDVDALLIDDIQFLANKERTQEVFHNIFNDFHTKKKQIILSSDRPPRELPNIESRLKSRFGLGVVVDISSPDYETRMAIMQHKLLQKDVYISDILLGMVAEHIKTNVRELEWCLNTLITKQKMMGIDIEEKDVMSCLQSLWYDTHQAKIQQYDTQEHARSPQNFNTVVEMVAQYYAIGVSDIKGDWRKKDISNARQILMYLAKKHLGRTLEKIGMFFGGKDHTAVIYAVDNISKKMKTDDMIAHDVRIFTEWLQK